MKESAMWTKLRRRLSIGHKSRLTRIENVVATGTPDLNCTVDGRRFWIESKCAKPTMREGSLLLGRSHRLTVEQINFHIAEHRAGGVSWVWVQMGRRHFLFPGLLAPIINDLTIQKAITYEVTLDKLVKRLLSD